MFHGTRPEFFTEDEWDAVLDANALMGVTGDQLLVLYRHWRWAYWLAGCHATELVREKRRGDEGVGLGWEESHADQVLEEPPRFGIALEDPSWGAHYIWMAVLRSVVEAAEKHLKVVLPGRLGEAVHRTRQVLTDQRNAVLHSGAPKFWDSRLTRIWDEDDSFQDDVWRVNLGLGGLIMAELQIRDALGITGPRDTRDTDPPTGVMDCERKGKGGGRAPFLSLAAGDR